MTESIPFAFAVPKIPQPSSDASMRAKLARLERENATLQRELRDANDANGVARVQAVAKNEVQEAQRETKRAQMAERIARKVLDDIHNTRKMAQDSTVRQEEMVKLEKEQEDFKENGKPQVETETAACQGLPAGTSGNTDDTTTIHDACECARRQERNTFAELYRRLSSEAVAKNEKLEAANDKLEATNKKLHGHLQELESRFAEAEGQLEKVREEAKRNAQKVELAASLEDKLRIAEDERDELLEHIEERVNAGLAEANEMSKRQQAQLQDNKTRLDQAITEIQGLNYEAEGYEKELDKVRSENIKLQRDLEHQKQVEKHLSENNERLLADLTDERYQRKALAVERDELEVQLAKTHQALQETEKSEAKFRRAFETSQVEFGFAAHDVIRQKKGLQEQVDDLTAQVDEHADHIATRDQRIETLKRENEVLKSELEDACVHKPSPEDIDIPRPVNFRSISMASHKSLADELNLDDDQSISDLSDDEEPAIERVELELSTVHHISIASCEIAKPQLTVSVSDTVATTTLVRQDSPLGNSPVNSVSSIEPSHPAPPGLSMYEDTVADFAPSQPAKPPLASFEKTLERLSPITPSPALLSAHVGETLNITPVKPAPTPAPAPQLLTMHVFNHSVISVDAESGSVVVTDPHTDRAEVNIFKKSAELDHPGLIAADENRSHWQKVLLPPALDHLEKDCPSAGRRDFGPMSRITASSLRRRSPIDPFTRSSKLSDANDLEKHTASWPVEDEMTSDLTTLPHTRIALTTSDTIITVDIVPISAVTTTWVVSTAQKKGLNTSMHILMLFLMLVPGSRSASLLPVLSFIFGLLSTIQRLHSIPPKPVSIASTKGLHSDVHYFLHALVVLLAFFCWRFWNQFHAWEYANGVGFGEGYGNAYDDFGPYGNGHVLLSMLPLNWVSADSHLPARAVEVITSTVSAFEGLMGFGPTPAF